MSQSAPLAAKWMQVATAWLPFADAASAELPLSRLLRLALFQVSVGMAAVLLTGTLILTCAQLSFAFADTYGVRRAEDLVGRARR